MAPYRLCSATLGPQSTPSVAEHTNQYGVIQTDTLNKNTNPYPCTHQVWAQSWGQFSESDISFLARQCEDAPEDPCMQTYYAHKSLPPDQPRPSNPRLLLERQTKSWIWSLIYSMGIATAGILSIFGANTGQVWAMILFAKYGHASFAKSSTRITFSCLGKLANSSTNSTGAPGPMGTQMMRALAMSACAACTVRSWLMGLPSVMTTTMEAASSRPYMSSACASARATEVSVVAEGHWSAVFSMGTDMVLFEKCLIHLIPQSFSRSGAPAVGLAPVHL
mmetsp:Transcript_28140/g.90631  ORF Transcript_28140/g.90631 Transcript_28140/m.90631 type:complete len:278 (+) Transcript_28140:103-936(+)